MPLSELTPEQQAELAIVRVVAESLRRRMPDLDDFTLGRVVFNLADLLNGVAVVLSTGVRPPGAPAAEQSKGNPWTEGWLARPDSYGPEDGAEEPASPGDRSPVQTGPWRAGFYQNGDRLEQAQWPEREQALRAIAGRVRWLAFDGTDVTVRLIGPGGVELGHEAVMAAIEELRHG
jgi:hypothetical protein